MNGYTASPTVQKHPNRPPILQAANSSLDDIDDDDDAADLMNEDSDDDEEHLGPALGLPKSPSSSVSIPSPPANKAIDQSLPSSPKEAVEKFDMPSAFTALGSSSTSSSHSSLSSSASRTTSRRTSMEFRNENSQNPEVVDLMTMKSAFERFLEET